MTYAGVHELNIHGQVFRYGIQMYTKRKSINIQHVGQLNLQQCKLHVHDVLITDNNGIWLIFVRHSR